MLTLNVSCQKMKEYISLIIYNMYVFRPAFKSYQKIGNFIVNNIDLYHKP